MRTLILDRLNPSESIASITIDGPILTIVFRNLMSPYLQQASSDELRVMPHFRRYFPKAVQIAEQPDLRHYHHRPDEMTFSHMHFDLGIERAPNSQEVRNIIYALRESSRELEGLSSIPFLFPIGRVFLTEDSAKELLQQVDDVFTAYEPTEFLYHSSAGRPESEAVSPNRPLPRLDVPTADSLRERREQNSRNATSNTVMLFFLIAHLLRWLVDRRSRRPHRREAIPPNIRPPMDPDDAVDENKSNTEDQRDTLFQAAHQNTRSTTTETELFQQREEDTSETEQQDENNDRQSLLDDGMRHRHRYH